MFNNTLYKRTNRSEFIDLVMQGLVVVQCNRAVPQSIETLMDRCPYTKVSEELESRCRLSLL